MTANLPVVFDPRAEDDVDAAVQWYAQQQSKFALEFLEALDAALGRVVQYPEAYSEVDSGIRRALMKKFPYFIYYTVDSNRIAILAVLHTRRAPDTSRQRLE